MKNYHKLKVTHFSELKVGYKRKQLTNHAFTSPEHVVDFMRPKFTNIEWHEEFFVIGVGNSDVLGYKCISSGGLTATVADRRMIFGILLGMQAVNFFIVHNHPTGNLNASDTDIRLSRKVAEAGLLFDMQLLDSIIITKNAYSSIQY